MLSDSELKNVNSRDRIRSVVKAYRILQIFAQKPYLTFSEINAKMEMPVASLYRFLATLLDCGLLYINPQTKQYSLGSSIIYLGNQAVNAYDIVSIALPLMENLKESVNETISLFVRQGFYKLCIAKVESDHQLRYSTTIGLQNPLHGGASGNVLMSGMTKKELDDLEATHGFQPFTAYTPSKRSEIDSAIEKTRENGYSVSYEERRKGTAGIGVPVFDCSGKVVAALNITLPAERFNEEKIPEWVKLLKKAGMELSQRNGYLPPESFYKTRSQSE